MPFTEPTTLTINVTLADIAASTTASNMTNSLAIAMKRLGDNFQLPGQVTGETIPGTYYAELNPRFNNGTPVSIYDAFCFSIVYSVDYESGVKLLLESVGVKPSVAYTATLVKA